MRRFTIALILGLSVISNGVDMAHGDQPDSSDIMKCRKSDPDFEFFRLTA